MSNKVWFRSMLDLLHENQASFDISYSDNETSHTATLDARKLFPRMSLSGIEVQPHAVHITFDTTLLKSPRHGLIYLEFRADPSLDQEQLQTVVSDRRGIDRIVNGLINRYTKQVIIDMKIDGRLLNSTSKQGVVRWAIPLRSKQAAMIMANKFKEKVNEPQ